MLLRRWNQVSRARSVVNISSFPPLRLTFPLLPLFPPSFLRRLPHSSITGYSTRHAQLNINLLGIAVTAIVTPVAFHYFIASEASGSVQMAVRPARQYPPVGRYSLVDTDHLARRTTPYSAFLAESPLSSSSSTHATSSSSFGRTPTSTSPPLLATLAHR
jgi:hypothetical protein